MEKRNLYPIGKAAEICKVSPRALRYYEEKGLIKAGDLSQAFSSQAKTIPERILSFRNRFSFMIILLYYQI